MNNADIQTLAAKFKELKEKSESIENELKQVNAEWSEVELLLLEALVNEGVKTIKLDGLGTYTLKVTNYLSVNAANKPSFLEYLKRTGNGGLIKEDVNSKTLTAFLRGHLDDVAKRFVEKENDDEVTARNKALEFLNKQGANYFTKREIAFRKEG